MRIVAQDFGLLQKYRERTLASPFFTYKQSPVVSCLFGYFTHEKGPGRKIEGAKRITLKDRPVIIISFR